MTGHDLGTAAVAAVVSGCYLTLLLTPCRPRWTDDRPRPSSPGGRLSSGGSLPTDGLTARRSTPHTNEPGGSMAEATPGSQTTGG